MKKNLTKAVRFEVRKNNGERFIQLFDECDNELDGENAYWEGDFNCRYNQLKTLKGCPEVVNGWFDCSYNNLTTLKGCPEVVDGSFFCSNNQLTTLVGCPKVVNGRFDCSHNNLTTLEGCPKVVNGWFDCDNNQLTTLVGCPKVVDGSFSCSYNKLTTLEGAPKLISGKFYTDSKLDASTIFSINTKTDKELFDRALELGYVLADNILTKMISKKTVKGIQIYHTQDLNNEGKAFVVSDGTHFSHGKTIKEALLDLDYKKSDRNKDLYKTWNKDTEVSLNKMILAYRVITGACNQGVNEFIKSNKLPSKVKVKDVIKLTEGHYGHEEFTEFFQ
ncbi:MAG: hypothetical protein MOGMAGMI_00324 [Candidatus Omnitrophica bacterium]|nr:hypothetical protein [Candidatus Omnitrophota bacterium]